MVSENIFIDAGNKDTSRPSERPPKSNWKRELLILVCRVLQYPFPDKIADIFWEHFRKPQKAVFTEPQKKLIRRAKMSPITYKNCKIVHFQWGQSDRKVLLSHGWNSKIADFRRMIEHLEEAGFQVEGIDMKAHGKSEGTNTALPEIIDILKNFYQKKGPYDAVIGYSIGGLGAGLMTAEVPAEIRPQHLIMIAAPPYTTFLFKRTIKDLGFRNKVYEKVAMLLERTYGNPINHYDVRHKGESFSSTQLTFVYDEDDQTIPFEKGLILKDHYPEANFIHTKGLGHYNVITYPPVNEQIRKILTD
ncbi:MAG: alpha/beta fold hydrolase [Cyclobacteriaceae bacterium]